MKKIAVFLVLASLLTGCGIAPVIREGKEETAISAESTAEETVFSETETEAEPKETAAEAKENVLYVAKLPETYFVTYEIANEDGVIETLSKAVDEEGNIYYQAEEEYLFLREGDTFILYQRDGENFVRQTDKKYQKSYVENLTKDFETCVNRANLNTGGIAEQLGEETIAGRQCMVYEIRVKVINFEQKYRFMIDQNTYACLKWESEKNISGYEEAGADSFTCVRFDTTGIDLEEKFGIE